MHAETVGMRSVLGGSLAVGMFVGARHSTFKLVHLSHPPAMGNVALVRVKGLYVSCGTLPGWGSLTHTGSKTVRWLVVVHGWAMTPFMCMGQ